MILRIQKGLVVILPMNVRQLFTDLVEIRQGDDFAVDFTQVLTGCRHFPCDDIFLSFMGSG